MTTKNIEEILSNFNTNSVRQGDFVLYKVDAVPKGYDEIATDIVAHGESGNTHKLIGDAKFFEDTNGDMIIQTGNGLCQVVHQQHETVYLEPNTTYKKLPELEWDTYKEEVRQSMD